MMKGVILFSIGFLLVTSCQPKPKPIDYGLDLCHYCMMAIVDDQYGAELVTSKAKVFKFDAVECMLNHVKADPHTIYPMHLVNTFDRPGQLVDAAKCVYLISENLPSPMGANLTAFAEEMNANRILVEKGGRLLDWSELKDQFDP